MPLYQLPENMLYNKKEQILDGSVNWVSYKPLDRSTFIQDESLKIRISSLTDFLVPQRSYLRYKLRLTGGAFEDIDPVSIITKLGGAAVINRVTTTVAGAEIERIDNYNVYLSHLYNVLPSTQQTFLQHAELYQDSLNKLANTAAQYSNGYYIHHALRTGVLEQDNLLPLPFLRGGIEFELQLASLNTLLGADDNNVTPTTGYTIEDVEFVACLLKPSSEYLQAFASKLQSGEKAKMSVETIRRIGVAPSTSTDQETVLNIGFHKSLKQVSGVLRTNATITNGAGTDTFQNNTFNNLSEVHFRIGSEKYPKNFNIRTGAYSIENQMQGICSMDNTYGHYNGVASATGTDDYIFYNWASNSSFGSGVPVEDGTIVFAHKYSAAPTASNVIDLFFNIEGELTIGYDAVNWSTKDI